MGLILSVYRDADPSDCTNGGITSRFKNLTVVNADGPFEPTPDRPAVLLEEGFRGSVRLVPAMNENGVWVKARQPGHNGPMFGGNYAATSDSRFGQAIRKITGNDFYGAVAVHDRYETPELSNFLSR